MKPKSYAPDDEVWLNSKYIKIKQNWKLKTKFLRLLRVLPSSRKTNLQTRATKEI